MEQSLPIQDLVQVFQTDAHSFMEILADKVAERLFVKMQSLSKPDEEKLLSPKETCKLFNPSISLVTLDTWAYKGLLTKYHIGGRTYYKHSEVINSLQSLKKYQRQPVLTTSNA